LILERQDVWHATYLAFTSRLVPKEGAENWRDHQGEQVLIENGRRAFMRG